jgi:hypothetical protein
VSYILHMKVHYKLKLEVKDASSIEENKPAEISPAKKKAMNQTVIHCRPVVKENVEKHLFASVYTTI